MTHDRFARWHLLFGLVLAIAGMVLGIVMASSQNHQQHVTHAHALLVGFVVSTLYAAIYQLWLPNARTGLAWLQTLAHEAGALVLAIGLFLLYGGILPEASIGPILGIGAIAVLVGMIVMLAQVVMVPAAARRATPPVAAGA